MVVSNEQHETAIVIRRDGTTAVFVRLKVGKLSCERLPENLFRAQWTENNFPLAETLTRFFEHLESHGCTQEALKGLEKLRARDKNVIASLF